MSRKKYKRSCGHCPHSPSTQTEQYLGSLQRSVSRKVVPGFAKDAEFWLQWHKQSNNVILDYNPKDRINIHESILISVNDWINSNGEANLNKWRRIPLINGEEFQSCVYRCYHPCRKWTAIFSFPRRREQTNNIRQTQKGDILQDTRPELLKTVKVTKNEEGQRNCQSVSCVIDTLGWFLELKEDINKKTWWN